MKIFAKIFIESFRQAFVSLTTNKLRTTLSLLGILIGIFSIIAVMSAVDSLEQNIKDGFEELGNNMLYIDKMPWTEDPGQNYWKYMKRPDPDYEDYEAIEKRSKYAESAAYCVFTGGKTLKFEDKAVSNAFVMGSTFEYVNMSSVEIESGRYFAPLEYDRGTNDLILGNTVAQTLFGNNSALGQDVKFLGQRFTVIGVLKAEGENMFNFMNFDEVIWIPYTTAKRLLNAKQMGEMLCVQAKEGVELEELKGELTSIMRGVRKLRPVEDDNFAINEVSMLEQVIGPLFAVMNVVGFTIGIFALIVGMFSVSNIMFVSVKERTSLIGIKKALGASKPIILSEFLIESIILCLIGGISGIIFVKLLLAILSAVSPLSFDLSITNILIGLIFSMIVGVLSGIIPALQAANLDPVEAIRS